jgi:1-acyl-sn-glycerol-3-phosphate acyltransferase
MKRPPEGVPGAGRAYRFAAAIGMLPITAQRWRLDVRGLEHVPVRGGAVIVANHTSYVDFFTVGRAPFLELGRPIRILGKASLFRTPGLGPFMRAAGHIPVERGAGSGALSAAVVALTRGELVCVLPEQTISPSLELLEFKTGAVRMAQLAGVPVIPAISWGSHRFLTVGGSMRPTWRLPVTVAFGAPWHIDAAEDVATVTSRLRAHMADMLAEVQQDYPDGLPAGARWVPARLGGSAPTQQRGAAIQSELQASWAAVRRRRRARRPRTVRGGQ